MVTLSIPPTGNAPEVPVYEARTLYLVPIDRIREDPNQPRKFFDPEALAELVASVKKHGILQPVLFRRGPEGTAIIVAGERRVAAAQQAGLTEIPGIFIDGIRGHDPNSQEFGIVSPEMVGIVSPEINSAEIALVENLQRQDLTSVEEAEALQRLKDEQKYTDDQLSAVIGRARTTLSDILLINRLPEDVRNECRGDRKVSKNVLIEIARKKQARAMVTAWTGYKEKQAKAAAGNKRQEKTAATPEELIDWVGKTNAKLTALDPAAWTEEEKTALAEALGALKKTLLALLKK